MLFRLKTGWEKAIFSNNSVHRDVISAYRKKKVFNLKAKGQSHLFNFRRYFFQEGIVKATSQANSVAGGVKDNTWNYN